VAAGEAALHVNEAALLERIAELEGALPAETT